MDYRIGDMCHECEKTVLKLPHDCPGRKVKKVIPWEILLTRGAIEDIDRHLGIKDKRKVGTESC